MNRPAPAPRERYVLGFLFSAEAQTHEKRVVLIKKTHPAWQAGRMNGVGGHVQQGEGWAQAMRREFEEEAGVAVHDWEYFATMHQEHEPNGRGGGWIVRCYKAFDSIAYERARTTSAEEIYKLPVKSLSTLAADHLIIENLAWLIPLALDSALFQPTTINYT